MHLQFCIFQSHVSLHVILIFTEIITYLAQGHSIEEKPSSDHRDPRLATDHRSCALRPTRVHISPPNDTSPENAGATDGELATSRESLSNRGPPAPCLLHHSKVAFEARWLRSVRLGTAGAIVRQGAEMSPGKTLLGGEWAGCARCWHVWNCPCLGVCLLPQHSHKVYHVACFVYIKGRVHF